MLACFPNTRKDQGSPLPSESGVDSEASPLAEDYLTADGATMIAIRAGSFEMGSADYAPAHEVTLTHDFWIGQTEVTQAQYIARIATNPSAEPGCGDTCPVDQVTWAMAALYANAMSTSEGLKQCYTASGTALVETLSDSPYACEGYRLPTDAEWEHAARAGEAYTYAGSDNPEDVAWTYENSGGTSQPVASKVANGVGLYDMSGNVWEWTGDWYAAYTADPATDPTGAASGDSRVNRGGSWLADAANARVASRAGDDPGYAYFDVGFRLVRTTP